MDGGGFVSFRRFVHAWSVHAEADESRSTAATPPPSAWTKAGSTFEQPINEVRDHQQVLESPWQLAQTALRELLERSEAQTLNVANVSSSNSRDLAAAGAMFLAASIGAEAPLFKMATVTEESAVRLLSKLPMVAFEDMLSASSLASMQESLPAIVATSLLVASAMGAANGQLPSEAAEGPAEWLQELNATAQKIWESGTGSLNTQATTLLREVEKLWAAVDSQLSVEEVEAAAAATPVASSSHGIALRCGSARQQGTDWILPLEAFRKAASSAQDPDPCFSCASLKSGDKLWRRHQWHDTEQILHRWAPAVWKALEAAQNCFHQHEEAAPEQREAGRPAMACF